MNYNIYIEDALGLQLQKYLKKTGKKRNGVIREALKKYLGTEKKWGKSIQNFIPKKNAPRFEDLRKELIEDEKEIF